MNRTGRRSRRTLNGRLAGNRAGYGLWSSGRNGSRRLCANSRRSSGRGRLCPGGAHTSGFGGSFLRRFFRGGGFFGSGFGGGQLLEMFADFFRGGEFNRTGVSLLFGDANFGEIVDDGLRLDFEVAGQFVDADLIDVRHSSVDYSFGSSPVCSAPVDSSEDGCDSA